jgi:hypothetical protein
LKNGGERWGKIRFERQQRFDWAAARPVSDLQNEVVAAMYWGSVFGHGEVAGKVVRIQREVQTVKLIERVQHGELKTAQFERMATFLDVERLGLADVVYSPALLRARRREARELNLAAGDAEIQELELSLDEVLSVPRSAWELTAEVSSAA